MSIYCTRLHIYPGNRGERPGATVSGYSDNDLTQVDDVGALETAHIPTLCIPGHHHDEQYDSDEPVAEWLRLGIADRPYRYTDVLLNVAAVQALRDDLDAWLALEKVSIR
ncbi:MAG: hypothetical protein ACRDQA_02890 [Nocardioidaceae bacterium]